MQSVAFNLILLLISFTAIAIPSTTSATTIGVTYSTPAPIYGSVPISPDRIAAKVVEMNIQAVRLPDSDPQMIRAFADTNVAIFLSIPNPVVPLLASNLSFASLWVYQHVFLFYPRSKISLISVGNDVITSYSYSRDDPPLFLLKAMQNIQKSLEHLGIFKISVSTTFSFFSIVPTAFPPSSAQFEQGNGEAIIRPILRFLERTNSSFMIKIDPYQMYRSSSSMTLGFAILETSRFNFREDPTTGVSYHNLFDLMVDAVISSMAVMGHNLPVIVAETGWPSSGIDAGETDATPNYSGRFLRSLIGHLKRGSGTPLRKEGPSEVYIFELVDEYPEQQGTRRNWGMLDHSLTEKYQLLGLRDSETTFAILLTFLKVCFPLALLMIASHMFIGWYIRRNDPPRPVRRNDAQRPVRRNDPPRPVRRNYPPRPVRRN